MTGREILILSSLFFAHYLGDFSPLATARMQAAKADGGPLLTIAAHAAVHSLLAGLAVLLLAAVNWSTVLVVIAIIFVSHFALDALKARLGQRFPALNSAQRNEFWYVLGMDQFAHALVLIFMMPLVT